MLKIGTLSLRSKCILAPLAGVSDLPFRMLNREFGCELAFVEMLNVRSVGFKSRKTKQMLATEQEDRPLGVQILGSEPAFISRALGVLRGRNFEVLDFNAACPVRKVVRRGEGAGLLRDPKKLAELVKLVKLAGIERKIPVTVKIRTGWDAYSVNAREVALFCEDAGADAIFLHGRTKVQEYSGAVDYGVIAKVKKALSIPLIASGDVFSATLAKKMLEETGCDGLLVARGALGNPWIFKEIDYFLTHRRELPRPSKLEIVATMIKHLRMCTDFYGERSGVVIYRKFFAWYTKGFRRVRFLRNRISEVKTLHEAEELIMRCGE